MRRGQGYRLHVTPAPHVHHALLAAAAPLGADGAASAARKAYRSYADRLTAAAILTDPAPVTSSPVGGMTALLACSRALRGARE